MSVEYCKIKSNISMVHLKWKLEHYYLEQVSQLSLNNLKINRILKIREIFKY